MKEDKILLYVFFVVGLGYILIVSLTLIIPSLTIPKLTILVVNKVTAQVYVCNQLLICTNSTHIGALDLSNLSIYNFFIIQNPTA